VDRLAAVLLLGLAALLAAGCGAARHAQERTLVVAALGDAVTAGAPGYYPDDQKQRRVYGFGSDLQSQWEWWAYERDKRIQFVNCGVWHERTDQIAKRLDRCAAGAKVLIVQGGIVDVQEGVPVARAAANLDRMVRRGKALGLRVAIADVLPWNNGYPAAAARIRRLDSLVHAIARREHVLLLPFNATLRDPSDPDRMREIWTADGENPSIAGYRRLGELAFRLP
jgi:lysophospholipase L1-like esterase